MPYVEGESLRDRLRRERRIPLAESVRIIREIAGALGHAHEHGVVHRDIKPENILFEAGHAIVSDFGVARAVTVSGDETITATGIVVGTPAYMSPEQAIGDRDIDSRTDVYSLGCVAFEMLSGERPFAAASAQAVLARKMLEAPTDLRDVVHDIPEPVAQVVATAMAKDAVDRYASATDFATALQEAASRSRAARPAITTTRRGPARRYLAVGAAAVALLAAGVLAPRWLREAPITSLAVLPFSSAGVDSLQQYVVDGIQDEIIGELGRVTALRRVISRTSVMQYRNTTKTIPQIASELGVDAVVEAGLYRVARDSVRIQLRLVRAAPAERQVWTQTYDTEVSNLRALHREVTSGLVDELRTALTGTDKARGAAAQIPRVESATNPAAYDAYLQGKYWLNKRTAEGMARAEAEFRRAIGLDPTFADAHAALASALALVNDWHYKAFDPIAVSREAIAEANRALELDSLSGEALAARGRVLSAAHAPEAVVRRDFERAIRAVPHHANAHGWYAMELAWRGRAEESRAQNDTSIGLDPTSPGRHLGFGISSVNIGDFEVGLREGQRVRQLEPTIILGQHVEGVALLGLGRANECASMTLARYPGIRAMCLHAAGREAEARRLADSTAANATQAVRRGGPFSQILLGDNLAFYYAFIGDVDLALHWTKVAGTLTTATPTSLFYRSPAFDPVRNDSRFVTGIEKINAETWRRVNTPPLKLN
jgi:eukaryotic-like serine/threonine-protein kinase